jgi:hypothetical protein
LFLSALYILVGAQISVFPITQNMGSVSRSLGFHRLLPREGTRILVARKIKVAIYSFDVNHLPISESCVGFLVKIDLQLPQDRTNPSSVSS